MIVKHSDLSGLREKYRDKKIVVGSGVFDLLHLGHVGYIQSLADYGDVVVILVKPDARIKKLKHPNRPVIPQDDRAQMVDSIKGVDYVIIGSSDTTGEVDAMYEKIFKLLNPDKYVSSNDTWSKLRSITEAKVTILPRDKMGHFTSTTAVIEYIKSIDSF